MDISELKGTVLQRYQELTDEEAGILQTIEQHPVGEIIMKLIGPELEQIFSEPESETDRMLSERTVGEPPNKEIVRGMPRYERAPMQDIMERDMPVDDTPQAMEREMASR